MVATTLSVEARAADRARRVDGGLLVRVGTTLVLVGIVYAALSKGAFYLPELRFTLLVVSAGLAVGLCGVRPSRRDIEAPVIAPVALGIWYLCAGAAAHGVTGAMPAVIVLAEVAAIVLIMRRADAHERRVVLAGLLAMGALVAATGWVGVAWRQYPRALEDGGLWRAASTITYANATGGLLAALAVLALGVFVVERGRSLTRVTSRLAAYVLVVGLLATASRAGMIAFAAGLAVAAVSTRGRALVHGWPVLVGAVIAIAALLPSMPARHEPRPLLACIGLTLGAAIAIAPTTAIAMVTISMTIVLVSVPGWRHTTIDAFQSVRESRVSVTSPDRTHELGAAVQLAKDHPITGVGPGQVDLTWDVTSPAPATMHAAYAHNEYLQVLDESGAIGLGILVAGLAAVIGRVWRARRHIDAGIFAGCAGALAALAVHSSMDFLWHIPLIPLTGAVLVGALLPDPRPLAGLDPSRGTA